MEVYQANGGPINMEKKRYKTVSTAFISEAYRRFEVILAHDMKRMARQLTGPEMRSLYSIFLNAQGNFSPSEYDCFRKCVKICYDLGSVSIYEHQAIDFLIAVQMHLKERCGRDGERAESEFRMPKQNLNLPVNIYAPMRGGGYEERLKESRVDDFPEFKEGQSFLEEAEL
jgi:hypothetical protein